MGYDVYRGLLSALWDDEFIVGLSDQQALFFLFLIVNPRQTPAGFFRATPDQLAADFRRDGVTGKMVKAWLADFQDAGKVVTDRGWVWVVNFVRHRRELNPMVARSMTDLLNKCDSRLIYDGWLRKYRHFARLADMLGPTTFCGPEPIAGEPAAVGPKIAPEPKEKHLFEDEVGAVWNGYLAAMKCHLTLTPKRRDKIISRLKDKITDPVNGELRATKVEDLVAAIRACAASDFHMGRENGHPSKYNSLEDHILKSQEQLEKWLQKAPRPKPSPVAPRGAPSEAPDPPPEVLGPPLPPPPELAALVGRVAARLDANAPKAPKVDESREAVL